MKKSILTLIAMALALGACAESVSPEMAIAAANAWVVRNGKFDSGRVATGQVITVRDTNPSQTVLWHQVSMSGDGCVIVAPVTEIEPVVVALDNDPGELPAAHPLRGILTGDMRQRLQFLGLYPKENAATLQSVKPGAPVDDEEKAVAAEWAQQQEAKWGRLGIGKMARLQAGTSSVGKSTVEQEVCVVKGFQRGGPLTHWNQGSNGGGYCYNYYTPGHVVCGCVATACSAIVQFFNATNSEAGVRGDCTYNGAPYPCRTKGGDIDWSLFDSCKKRSDYNHLSDEQREVLGRVAYDAGVGVEMSWAAGGSGAYESAIATTLKDVFGFKYARYVGLNGEHPGEENLRKLIYGQCAAGAPVGMSIEGHSVVAVGYGIDDQDVERVRVFMGWGGSGDGWYALPLIDTKSVAGGSTYLSKVVDGVVTMINYDSADIVPVVGQVTAPGFSIIFNDVLSWQQVPEEQEVVDEETGEVSTNTVMTRKLLPRVVETDDNGWFATRVPPNVGHHTFTIAGKIGEYTIGSAAQSSGNAGRLRSALPDWFLPFPLLNSSVAFSFEGAIKMALEEDKAILRVSGQASDTNTQCVLDYIYHLDDENVNDFTNRFVYYYTGFTSTNADMRPSYAVFLPQASHVEERWYLDNGNNGRLAYGYARYAPTKDEVTLTNITEEVVFEEDEDGEETSYTVMITNIVTAVTTNVIISTYAPTGSTPDIEEFDYWPVFAAAAQPKYQWSIDQVLEMGWEQYTKKSSDISVTVLSQESPTAGTPNPGWGTNKDMYKVGDVIVATAPGEATNETAGVVMGCTGYLLDCENGITGQTYHMEGTTTSVTLPAAEKGDHFTITWLTGVKAVKIDISVSPQASAGTFSPASGWYPCGEPVVFTANPAAKWAVERWSGQTAKLPEGVVLGGGACPSVYVMPTEKTALNVKFRQMTREEIRNSGLDGTNCTLTVSCYFMETEEGDIVGLGEENTRPDVFSIELSGDASIAGTVIKNGSTVSLTNLVVGMRLKPEIYTDRWGQRWQCMFWNLYDAELGEEPAHTAGTIYKAAVADGYSLACGEAPFWGFKIAQDSKLVLYWVPVEEGEDPDDPVDPDPEDVELEINWNDTLDNLHSGDNVVLSAEVAKTLDPKTKISVGQPPLGWKTQGVVKKGSDGSLVVSLALDEEVLAPKGDGDLPPLTIFYNDDGTLTVKAEITNGIRGFWYSLFTADELKGPWGVVKSGYEEGQPVKQAAIPESTGTFTLSIVVSPEEARRYYKLVVTEKNPSEE